MSETVKKERPTEEVGSTKPTSSSDKRRKSSGSTTHKSSGSTTTHKSSGSSAGRRISSSSHHRRTSKAGNSSSGSKSSDKASSGSKTTSSSDKASSSSGGTSLGNKGSGHKRNHRPRHHHRAASPSPPRVVRRRPLTATTVKARRKSKTSGEIQENEYICTISESATIDGQKGELEVNIMDKGKRKSVMRKSITEFFNEAGAVLNMEGLLQELEQQQEQPPTTTPALVEEVTTTTTTTTTTDNNTDSETLSPAKNKPRQRRASTILPGGAGIMISKPDDSLDGKMGGGGSSHHTRYNLSGNTRRVSLARNKQQQEQQSMMDNTSMGNLSEAFRGSDLEKQAAAVMALFANETVLRNLDVLHDDDDDGGPEKDFADDDDDDDDVDYPDMLAQSNSEMDFWLEVEQLNDVEEDLARELGGISISRLEDFIYGDSSDNPAASTAGINDDSKQSTRSTSTTTTTASSTVASRRASNSSETSSVVSTQSNTKEEKQPTSRMETVKQKMLDVSEQRQTKCVFTLSAHRRAGDQDLVKDDYLCTIEQKVAPKHQSSKTKHKKKRPEEELEISILHVGKEQRTSIMRMTLAQFFDQVILQREPPVGDDDERSVTSQSVGSSSSSSKTAEGVLPVYKIFKILGEQEESDGSIVAALPGRGLNLWKHPNDFGRRLKLCGNSIMLEHGVDTTGMTRLNARHFSKLLMESLKETGLSASSTHSTNSGSSSSAATAANRRAIFKQVAAVMSLLAHTAVLQRLGIVQPEDREKLLTLSRQRSGLSDGADEKEEEDDDNFWLELQYLQHFEDGMAEELLHMSMRALNKLLVAPNPEVETKRVSFEDKDGNAKVYKIDEGDEDCEALDTVNSASWPKIRAVLLGLNCCIIDGILNKAP